MNPTRRSFLGGIAVASALTGAGALASTSSAPVQEDPQLILLGQEFDKAHLTLQKAADALPAFQDAYRAIAPTGDGLIFEEHHRGIYSSQLDWFVDPTDPKYGDMRAPNGRRLMSISPGSIRRQMAAGTLSISPTTEKLLADAVKFEADINEALILSGLEDALQSYRTAEAEMRRTIWRLVEIRARTPAGVAIKVRSTAAFATLGPDERHSASLWLAKAIWSDLGEDE